MIQAASKRLNLNSPTSAISSSDENTIQLVALAQEEGKSLARRHPWQILTTEKTFTSTAAAAQVGAIPTDFDRFVDESFYNRTQKRPVHGPISPQDWQLIQATVSTAAFESFRVRGNSILITPTPNGTDTYAYEYISRNWCESAGGTDQSSWALDTDTGILDEELMTQGIEWRFLKAKGFDYAEAFRTYEISVADKFTKDGGRARLSFGRRGPASLHRPYIAEGSWPL